MKKAFSLIELLISLIVISLIIAAFTPVLSKKLKHREIALGGGGKIETKCSERFNEKCMICSDTECVLCSNSFSCSLGQYCDEADNCTCKSCSAKFSHCAKCTKNYCESCTVGYELNSGSCSEKTCAAGYYLSGSNCLPCTGETIQPLNNSRAASCSSCSDSEKANANHTACVTVSCSTGQYREGRQCKPCISPCATCTNVSSCVSCIEGYSLSGNECIKNAQERLPSVENCKMIDSIFISAAQNGTGGKDLCVTKYNMGDLATLAIPNGAGVEMRTANTDYSTVAQKSCYRGTTSPKAKAFSDFDYDPSTRTVCNWNAANAICANFHYGNGVSDDNWRLPTKDEITGWKNNYSAISKSAKTNGLQLCQTGDTPGCTGTGSSCKKTAASNLCRPARVWSSTLATYNHYHLHVSSNSSIEIGTKSGDTGLTDAVQMSTRCVVEKFKK